MEDLVKSLSKVGDIAIFGATSVLAMDFIAEAQSRGHRIVPFGREKLESSKSNPEVIPYERFGLKESYGAIINFVGFGSPKRALRERDSIVDVTREYDFKILEYLERNRRTKYIFVSSGAVYELTDKYGEGCVTDLNEKDISHQDLYAFAKLEAESRHRAIESRTIFDLRVFNYVSPRQSVFDGFLFTDIIEALLQQRTLLTAPQDIERDFADSGNFADLVFALLESSGNCSIDLYSAGSITKFQLLEELEQTAGLHFAVSVVDPKVEPTGLKLQYLPRSRAAESFGYEPKSGSLENALRVLKSLGVEMTSKSA
jgi:nucleoside-diphosphate-sugar epimerase